MTSQLVLEQQAFLEDFCRLVQFSIISGFTVTAGELLRPIEMQKIYVQTGRSKTMDSYHIKKLAGDLNFFKDGKYLSSREELRIIGEYWEGLNSKNRWGGNFKNFKDLPHFERRI